MVVYRVEMSGSPSSDDVEGWDSLEEDVEGVGVVGESVSLTLAVHRVQGESRSILS